MDSPGPKSASAATAGVSLRSLITVGLVVGGLVVASFLSTVVLHASQSGLGVRHTAVATQIYFSDPTSADRGLPSTGTVKFDVVAGSNVRHLRWLVSYPNSRGATTRVSGSRSVVPGSTVTLAEPLVDAARNSWVEVSVNGVTHPIQALVR